MECVCGTRGFPRFDPECHLHGHLGAQADGDSRPLRMTLDESFNDNHENGECAEYFREAIRAAELQREKTVWLLWRNEVVIGVFGSESAAWKELQEMQAVIGSRWVRGDEFGRVWNSLPWGVPSGVTLRMEPREVHR